MSRLLIQDPDTYQPPDLRGLTERDRVAEPVRVMDWQRIAEEVGAMSVLDKTCCPWCSALLEYEELPDGYVLDGTEAVVGIWPDGHWVSWCEACCMEGEGEGGAPTRRTSLPADVIEALEGER